MSDTLPKRAVIEVEGILHEYIEFDVLSRNVPYPIAIAIPALVRLA